MHCYTLKPAEHNSEAFVDHHDIVKSDIFIMPHSHGALSKPDRNLFSIAIGSFAQAAEYSQSKSSNSILIWHDRNRKCAL